MYYCIHFNPRAPYGARRRPKIPIAPPISNFNPRAPYGARRISVLSGKRFQLFQSTRPIRGATSEPKRYQNQQSGFQSTRPIRGATRAGISIHKTGHNFNPRAPYGARPAVTTGLSWASRISIHAPHTGRDVCCLAADGLVSRISIHAPHTGRDGLHPEPQKPGQHNFNPRAPYGARQALLSVNEDAYKFQSTRPIRGATCTYKRRTI